MLHPLIELSAADELDGISADVEISVRKDILSGGETGGMNHLAVSLYIDLFYVTELDADALRLLEHLGGLDGTSLVPEQEHGTRDEHEKSHPNALESLLEPSAIRCGGNFLVSHNYLN